MQYDWIGQPLAKQGNDRCARRIDTKILAQRKSMDVYGAQEKNYILSIDLWRLPDISEVSGNKKGMMDRILRRSF